MRAWERRLSLASVKMLKRFKIQKKKDIYKTFLGAEKILKILYMRDPPLTESPWSMYIYVVKTVISPYLCLLFIVICMYVRINL